MEFKLIDQRVCTQMKEAFDNFYREIKKMCTESDVNSTWMNNQDMCLLTAGLQHADIITLNYRDRSFRIGSDHWLLSLGEERN